VMSFVIQRNGLIADIKVAESSRNALLDLAAQRALVNTKALAPLPAGYAAPRLPVELEFVYTR
jgi:TonB family protein